MKKRYGAVPDPSAKHPIDMTDREFFAEFAKRTGLYIGYTDLRGVVTYIEGYDMTCRRRGEPGLSGWHEWLIRYQNLEQSPLAWWSQIQGIALPDHDWVSPLTKDQETIVLTVLFDLLDTFLAERESAQQVS
ncbi:hypothetical protein [Nocardia sp. AG03]|uniref:hypothetical protein n=1 Tax=Nocardia sp. AG03 TaxID=3025312 RepID=UPI0024186A01|nr:hypothetical protein [Nocardia sp. AG03]